MYTDSNIEGGASTSDAGAVQCNRLGNVDDATPRDRSGIYASPAMCQS